MCLRVCAYAYVRASACVRAWVVGENRLAAQNMLLILVFVKKQKVFCYTNDMCVYMRVGDVLTVLCVCLCVCACACVCVCVCVLVPEGQLSLFIRRTDS